MGRGHGRAWQAPHYAPLSDYEVMDHIVKLRESGLSLSAYSTKVGVHRRALADGIKRENPEAYAELVGTQGDPTRTGTKLETSAKQMLERRGYYVMKSHGSHSALDMIAVGKDKPTLMIQAKKDGKLGSAEWNAVFDLAEAHGCWPVLVSRGPDGKGALWYRLSRRREFREQQRGLLDPFDPREPYALALAVA